MKYEKRIKKLVKAYQKAFGEDENKCLELVKEAIEEDCIESVEANVADGLLSV